MKYELSELKCNQQMYISLGVNLEFFIYSPKKTEFLVTMQLNKK